MGGVLRIEAGDLNSRTLTLDDPTRANCMSESMVNELLTAIQCAADDGVRALVIRGSERHFSAGLDLAGVRSATDASMAYSLMRIGVLLHEVAATPCLTVAVVDGTAVGAGADLAAACDFRVASDGASFCFPGSAFGLVLGTARLASLVGGPSALEMVSSGVRIGAAEANRRGLVDRLCAADQLEETIRQILENAARIGDDAVGGVLRATRDPSQADAALGELCRSVAARPGLADRVRRYVASGG